MKRTSAYIPIFALFILLFSCNDENNYDIVIYEHQFDNENPNRIENYVTHDFNGSGALGPFNNDGFELEFNNLEDHKFIVVQFDLYIHDAWDGESVGIDGPDFWFLELTEEKGKANLGDFIFQTTFSTSPCLPNFCRPQSYPNSYPFSVDPDTGVDDHSNGRCFKSDAEDGTSIYHIEKYISHRARNAHLSVYDSLVQLNVDPPSCDESWSIDNLLIRLINF
ncbi:MAG: hypothetical protein R8G66_27645 [Cytophagales bacterium]|nr:hypothetical protein [Cytophagales bacterium]